MERSGKTAQNAVAQPHLTAVLLSSLLTYIALWLSKRQQQRASLPRTLLSFGKYISNSPFPSLNEELVDCVYPALHARAHACAHT